MKQTTESSNSSAATGNRRRILKASALLLFAILGFAFGAWIRMYKSTPSVTVSSNSSFAPEWGRRISAVQLKYPTYEQAIETLGRLSGAKVVVDWSAMPADVKPQTILPADVDLHDVSLGELLPWLMTKGRQDDRYGQHPIACRARDGRIYVSEAGRGAAFAPQVCEFNIHSLLLDMADFRKSHPTLAIDPSDFDLPPQQSIDWGSFAQWTTQPAEGLDSFLRAATDPGLWTENRDGMRILNDKLIVAKEPPMADQIGEILAHLRNDGDIEARRESKLPAPTFGHVNLDQVLASVDISLTSLPVAIAQLQQISGANIFVKRNLVEQVPPDGFALRAQNITLRDALKRLLRGTDLGFTIFDGLIQIEDRDRTESARPVTCYYAVGDLLARPSPVPATLPASEGWDNDPAMAMQQGLIKRIFQAVPDEDWPEGPHTGSYSSMRIIGNVLVVYHSPRVQERIKAALAEMRRGK